MFHSIVIRRFFRCPCCSHRWLRPIICAWNTWTCHFTTSDAHWPPYLMWCCPTHCCGKNLANKASFAVQSLLAASGWASTRRVYQVFLSIDSPAYFTESDQQNYSFISATFSGIGTVFGVIGSLSLSLYSIYTKKTLPYVNQEVLLMNYYVNLYSCILFIPLMMFSGEFVAIANYPRLFELSFWAFLTVGGICGFAIGYVTGLQIKLTSPLTHNISGTAKACAQTVMATQWYNESKSWLWWLSNFVVLFGSGLYARVKQLEIERQHIQRVHSQNI